MAPSTMIRKPKRAFSPPRPGKSKVTKSTKEKGAATTKSAAARRSLGATGNSKVRKQQQQRSQIAGQKVKPQKTKRRGAAGTMRAILGEADADSDSDPEEEDDGDGDGSDENMDTGVEEDESLGHEDDDDNDDDTNAQGEEDGEEEEEEASLSHDRDLNLSSPEPDFILAEVTTNGTGGNSTSSTSPSIPLPLIHRIMHAHFLKPDHTSLSSDARHLMGKYADIFVKEAIRRCVDDKRERAAARGSGDGGVVGDTGWLEVEDLERVAVQLCLDF
ncbi:hypothetical protein AYO20_01783 [Fonsecaea nubica]|uniref:Uncharacterized protein n=1 Tax=Fonsecaea nubica TaxID=856822 RepID=A0A178DBM9_9EURO|nr:hypothetical protein AYO20_01783 [Fonsecaea nubica]OAL39032.1 hypothetical protein AYO20_01783 [Fonsecaea nubica]